MLFDGDQAGGRKAGQFALHRAGTRFRQPDDLLREEASAGVPEEDAEYPLLDLREQGVGQPPVPPAAGRPSAGVASFPCWV